jgi:hypothetical protein
VMYRKAKGKVRGGGNAPASADLERDITIHEVIQIVHRARRPHLGLMENHDGLRGTSTRGSGSGTRWRTTTSSPTASCRPFARSFPGWP